MYTPLNTSLTNWDAREYKFYGVCNHDETWEKSGVDKNVIFNIFLYINIYVMYNWR